MKGVLLLFLATGTFAFSDLLSKFFSGFETGVQESAFALKNPQRFGEELNLLASMVPKTRKNLQLTQSSFTIADLETILLGIVTGLEDPDATGVSACSTDFNTVSYAVSTFLSTILNDINGGTFEPIQLVQVGCPFTGLVSLDFASDCGFNTLINNLETFTLQMYVDNYIGNTCDLNPAILNVVGCSNNYALCGQGIGTIIREELEWSI